MFAYGVTSIGKMNTMHVSVVFRFVLLVNCNSFGYKTNAEPFLSMTLQVFLATELLEIRTTTTIFYKKEGLFEYS